MDFNEKLIGIFIKEIISSKVTEWDPKTGFMSSSELIDLIDKKYGGDPDKLPMHGLGLSNIDDRIKEIITKFNPKYIINAGEESFARVMTYPISHPLYKYGDHHTVSKFSGIPTKIEEFDIKDHSGLLILQFAPNFNMSIILLKEEDLDFAKLISVDPNYNPNLTEEENRIRHELLESIYSSYVNVIPYKM